MLVLQDKDYQHSPLFLLFLILVLLFLFV